MAISNTIIMGVLLFLFVHRSGGIVCIIIKDSSSTKKSIRYYQKNNEVVGM